MTHEPNRSSSTTKPSRRAFVKGAIAAAGGIAMPFVRSAAASSDRPPIPIAVAARIKSAGFMEQQFVKMLAS